MYIGLELFIASSWTGFLLCCLEYILEIAQNTHNHIQRKRSDMAFFLANFCLQNFENKNNKHAYFLFYF